MIPDRGERTIALILFISVFVLAVPVAGETITIDNSSSIASALLCVGDSGTLILQPGIYFENSITLTNNTTITANISAGGSAADTIIDAVMGGRIFDTGAYSISVDSLSLRNGYADIGGAIYTTTGEVSINSSEFTNCSASQHGGAIDSNDIVTVNSSAFTDCSAANDGGAIYSYGSETAVHADNSTFTRCSGRNGGAIFSGLDDNPEIITSSTFINCTATNKGGAVYTNTGGGTTFESSTFTDCTAGSGRGGAIFSGGNSLLTIASSGFTNCTAGQGGAILSNSLNLTTITSSTFTNCSATNGGTIQTGEAVTLTISVSTFTGCSATGNGSAVNSDGAGTVTVTSSVFSDCSAGLHGGVIFSANDTITVDSSVFTGCSATNGGAIYSYLNTVTVNASTFTGCSADRGGAIFSANDNVTVNSSTLTDCTASLYGGAIGARLGSMHFSRIYNCSSGDPAVHSSESFNATNNWWGTNSDPSGFTSGPVTYTPWLVLGATADPVTIMTSETSVIRANLTHDVNGTDTSGSGFVPDGIPVKFDLVTGSASLSVTEGNITSGVNETVFTPATSIISTVNVTVDDQNVSVQILITPEASFYATPVSGTVPLTVSFTDTSTGSPTCWNWSFGDGEWSNTTNPGLKNVTHTYLSTGTYTVNLTVSNALGNDTESLAGYITVNTASSSVGTTSSGGGSNTNTGTGFTTDLEAGSSTSFDMDKGAVYMVTVTAGNDIQKLMITVQRSTSVPSSVGYTGTNVYEYEDAKLYYADASDVSGVTYYFKVEKNWLATSGYSYDDIVMMYYNEESGEWEKLATTFAGEDNTYYYYSADARSFSWLAITIFKGATIVPEGSEPASSHSNAYITQTDATTGTSSSSNVTAKSTVTSGNTTAQEEPRSWSSFAVPILLVLMLIIFIIIGLATRRKKDEYPEEWYEGRK
ncbi:polymorphic outer membrane protein [Methanolacinia petrolearia DSM 11571]|uniref:Polymorphic outer membrane protein n=1 Tax=Methanolacinia petrolearia (strain DSM 11571 / OCM 486 / SEBR 4847) TaxID=679926 RepID=E1RG41_METP4|nr:PKD domain-containing protein [Methanolacinia petrolearia]ADN36276.1 polymorphic outer membrane protein [Methanolacinia petrolearia DSM 11571]